MKLIIVFFLIFCLSFLEATVVALHLVLLAVIALGVWLSDLEVFFLAVFSGLILDLIKGGVWGFSSLQFLAIVFLISLYKNRFQAQKLWFLLPLALICIVFTDLLTGESFSIFKIIINTGLIVVFLPLAKIMIKKDDSRLRV